MMQAVAIRQQNPVLSSDAPPSAAMLNQGGLSALMQNLSSGMGEHEIRVINEALPSLDKAFYRLAREQRSLLKTALWEFLQRPASDFPNGHMDRWEVARFVCCLVEAGRHLGARDITTPNFRQFATKFSTLVKGSFSSQMTQPSASVSQRQEADIKNSVESAKITAAFIQRHINFLPKLLPPALSDFATDIFISIRDEASGQLSFWNFLSSRVDAVNARGVLGDIAPYDSIPNSNILLNLEHRRVECEKPLSSVTSVRELLGNALRYLNSTDNGTMLKHALDSELRSRGPHSGQILMNFHAVWRNGYLPLPFAHSLSIEEMVRSQLACLGLIGIIREDVKVSADGNIFSPPGFARHDIAHLSDIGIDFLRRESEELPIELEGVHLTADSLPLMRRLARSATLTPIYLKGCNLAKDISPETYDAYQIFWFLNEHESAGMPESPLIMSEDSLRARINSHSVKRIKNPQDIGGGLFSALPNLAEQSILEHLEKGVECFKIARVTE